MTPSGTEAHWELITDSEAAELDSEAAALEIVRDRASDILPKSRD